jgi:hypothetical protein
MGGIGNFSGFIIQQHRILETVPEIEGRPGIRIKVEKRAFLADGMVNMIVKGNGAEKLHVQGEMLVNDSTDEFPDVGVILLAVLIHQETKLEIA